MTTAATTPTPSCPACRATLSPGGRFCHRCGRPTTSNSGDRAAWLVGWSLVVIAVGTIVFWVLRDTPTPQGSPDMVNAGSANGTPPDISQMSPAERFLRLHDRVMAAAEQGDTSTVASFTPMALTAYGMLDKVDADLRYHAAALYLKVGGYGEALALADTIARNSPNHLLADVIRSEVAEARGDRAAATRSREQFLQHYAAQLATGRPEYTEHKALLEALERKYETP